MGVHISKEGSVRHIAKARRIVGHVVQVAIEESHFIQVAVSALVQGGVLAEVRRRPVGGGGSFVIA